MRKTALTALLLAATVASPAAAQDDGVFVDPVDPDSPAGKEYALPLDRAREEAAPGAGTSEDGGRGSGQPLFGVGIDRSRGAPADQDGGSPGTEVEATGTQGTSRQALAPNAYRPAAIESAANEGSAALTSAGIAAAVLGVGLLAGFGLRRLLRDSHPS